MPPLSPSSHRNLHLVRQALEASETEEVVYILVGDSRSSWRHYRRPGGFFRQVNVKHAALVCAMLGSSNMNRDGLGMQQVALAGITNVVAAPGGTLSGSGIVNTLPSEIFEAWTTGAVSSPHFSRYSVTYSTAGGGMDNSAADDSGGNFKRGDPAQSRNIASIERFAVTDNRASSAWLQNRIEYGYSGSESGAAGPTAFSAPPSAPGSDLLITAETLAGSGTGTQVTARNRHNSGTAAVGTGFITCAVRINFAGGQGIVLGVIAQGGWSSTDHLPNPSGGTANADAKYTDAGLVEWLTKVFKVAGKRVVFDVDLGTNGPSDGNFGEWNGVDSGLYEANQLAIGNRLKSAATTAGAASVLILSRSPWQAAGDSARIDAYRADLLAIADSEADWAYYDQEAELRAGGYSDGGANGLSVTYREDAAHQNYAGMNLLEQLFNDAVFGTPNPSGGTGITPGIPIGVHIGV